MALESTISYRFHIMTRHEPTDLISTVPAYSFSQQTKYDLYHIDSSTTESIAHRLFTDTPTIASNALFSFSLLLLCFAAAEFGIAQVRTVFYYLGFRWRIRVMFRFALCLLILDSKHWCCVILRGWLESTSSSFLLPG